MSQQIVPVPITRYIVNDKPSAFLDFQILNACGKKAEVVSVAAKKPMYSGLIILNNNIDEVYCSANELKKDQIKFYLVSLTDFLVDMNRIKTFFEFF